MARLSSHGLDVDYPRCSSSTTRANRAGAIVAVTLGNGVNLRDVEGRSALLLGRAKDNNASCSMGPFFRLFDDAVTLDAARLRFVMSRSRTARTASGSPTPRA